MTNQPVDSPQAALERDAIELQLGGRRPRPGVPVPRSGPHLLPRHLGHGNSSSATPWRPWSSTAQLRCDSARWRSDCSWTRAPRAGRRWGIGQERLRRTGGGCSGRPCDCAECHTKRPGPLHPHHGRPGASTKATPSRPRAGRSERCRGSPPTAGASRGCQISVRNPRRRQHVLLCRDSGAVLDPLIFLA